VKIFSLGSVEVKVTFQGNESRFIKDYMNDGARQEKIPFLDRDRSVVNT